LGEGLLQIGGEWYDPEGIEGPLPPADYAQPQQQPIDPVLLELQDLKAQGRLMPGLLRAKPYSLGAEFAGLISPGGPTYDHTLDENWNQLREKSPENLKRYMTWDWDENKVGEKYSKANRFLADAKLQKLSRKMEKNPNLPAGAKKEFTERIDEAKKTPLVLYHGTPKAWTDNQIDKEKLQSRDYGWFGSGFYTTPDPELAENYMTPDDSTKVREDEDFWEGEGNTIPIYANIQDPFKFGDVTNEDLDRIERVLKFYGHEGISKKVRKELTKPFSQRAVGQHLENWAQFLPGGEQEGGGVSGMGEKGDITTLLKLAGYDSSIGNYSPLKPSPNMEINLFEPNQAKSIFNQGTWNPLTEDLHTNLGSYLNASSTT